ncbi:23S rRNA (guanosine(2251)-2'-O)-methyltransferase RlmB [Nitrosomonas communis]|uniref:23S rRNA (guanosine-2'-O-)-methyltransferase RlmB n=1 Tax=Nitrosomonas communis TaxID=44574 RepID=A0A1H2WIV4_9PROT|nr:23S rRNA (guanosine(2251)-2'-O)-methyltransferase RlmB [Nitrosomonas communis]SDW80184.1 23S rRNA (guanosine2251-2'-O)-methyltransferase [Nitrosomonas communis]
MPQTRHIFGFHAIMSRLRQNPDSIKEIYIDSARHDQRARDLCKLAETKNIRLMVCDNTRLARMVGTTHHQGVVANIMVTQRYVTIEDILEAVNGLPLLLILDGIKDPHNLGACLRVADALGAHAVIAPKDRSVGLTATVHKVASGAADTVPFVTVTNLARTLRELKEQGIWVIGTAAEATDLLESISLNGPIAWVLGAEHEGMRRLTKETCDQLVRIPMVGSVESLNVSVSAGICLFETFRQRSRKV